MHFSSISMTAAAVPSTIVPSPDHAVRVAQRESALKPNLDESVEGVPPRFAAFIERFGRAGHLARRIAPLVIVAVFAAALWLLHRSLADSRLHDVLGYVRTLSAQHLAAALLFTVASYLALTGYDVLALRYVRKPLPYRETALTSFISYAFTHSMGFGALTGGSVRYRLYSLAGLNGLEITAVVIFCGLTFALGSMTIVGTVLAVAPGKLAALEGLPLSLVRAAGLLMLLLVCLWILWSGVARRQAAIGRWLLPPPSPHLAVQQIVLSCVEHMLTAAALYQLLPAQIGIGYPAFVGIYVVAVAASVVSHVPGGLGVFETLILTLLPGTAAPQLLGALLAFRLVYYLFPLGAAALLLAVHELARRRPAVLRSTQVLRAQLARSAPQLAAAAAFIAGGVLLFSGAVPTNNVRLELLSRFVPLPVLELSHFTASIAGIGLLLLARALSRRIDAAYLLTLVLIGVGSVFSLLGGLAYEAAAPLAVVGLMFAPARGVFYRRAALFDERLSGRWLAAIAIVLAGFIWLGFFAFRHVEYSHELWWQFAFDAKAPRFLRASLAVTVIAMSVALWQLLRPAAPPPGPARPVDLERTRRILAESHHASANVALLGDKSLLFSDSGEGFLMYGVHGRSWVALGDPVGPPQDQAELAWKFRELTDRFDGRAVFYQVDPENLPLYVDLGLSLFKIGEEARVPLAAFSLDGAAHRDLRYARRRAQREGGSFEVVEPAGVLALLPELQEVSDVWLAERKTREKEFSVGFFSADYLKNFPCAVVRKEGRVIAFGNIWLSGDNEEMSVDLMRYRSGALYGVMDFLFAEIMLWGQGAGYRWFSLGMAPLAGLEARPLAPVWYRMGAAAYQLGDRFYNFRGLRSFKAKFIPEWRPKYVAVRGGLSAGPALIDIAALISGDVRGIFAK
jgi:phosphatidylglycerol lysyltransferase